MISLRFVYFFYEAFPSIEISLNDFKGYFFRFLSLEEDFGLSLKAAPLDCRAYCKNVLGQKKFRETDKQGF